MESSFTESIARLNIVDMAALILVGCLIAYFTLSKRIHLLMFLLVLSATLVGSIIPVLGDIAPVVRWLVILIFFALGVFHAKVNLSPGFLLFWGYVLFGHIFLFNGILIQYQLQKSILLIIVAATIPLLFADRPFQSFKESLEAVASAGAIFSLLNFVSLGSFLTDPVRFSGYTKGAASLAIFLGGLLPFTFWGIWKSTGWVKILCVFGFLSGIITLLYSGQRTGTVIGIIGIIPLCIVVQNRKNILWSLIILIAMLAIGLTVYQQSSQSRKEYLANRFFSEETNLSGRDEIWNLALNEINTTPIFGRGIGASEMFFAPSFHNTYLEVWYNSGFFGLVLFVLSQIYFLYKAMRLVLISKDAQIRLVSALALGYMVGYIGMGFFESMGAGSSSVNLILYLFLCFLVSNSSALSPNLATLVPSRNPFSIEKKTGKVLDYLVYRAQPPIDKGK